MREKSAETRAGASASAVVESSGGTNTATKKSPRSVLLATNGSPEGDAALRFAIALARRLGQIAACRFTADIQGPYYMLLKCA